MECLRGEGVDFEVGSGYCLELDLCCRELDLCYRGVGFLK